MPGAAGERDKLGQPAPPINQDMGRYFHAGNFGKEWVSGGREFIAKQGLYMATAKLPGWQADIVND